jgi:hypothetical protein
MSVPKGKPLRKLPNLLASLPHLGEDEAASFEQDLDAARAELISNRSVCGLRPDPLPPSPEGEGEPS